jgi:Uma2 family endonuclease
MSDRLLEKASVYAEPASPELRRFTRAEYHAMAEAGVLDSEEKVELIDGRIYTMFPLGSWHSASTLRLEKKLTLIYGDDALVSTVHPVLLGENSEPEPDILVLRSRGDYYGTAQPQAADVILLIEIADSSRVFDLGAKHDLYAQHGIPEFWVVDKSSSCVHVFRRPSEGLFMELKVYRSGEEIPLPSCGRSLPIADTGI